MSKDIFRNVFGITDQQAGRLINFGDKKDIKNLRDYLKLSIPLQIAKELFLNVGREKVKAKEEINDVLGPQVKIATAEYNNTEAKKIRDELIKFNDPTQREDFIYEKATQGINRYVNEASNGRFFAYSPEINKVNPTLAKQINSYIQSQSEIIEEEYELKNLNPLYSVQTQEEFLAPYMKLALAEKNLIEDNPQNRNLITAGLSKVFPKYKAAELFELTQAVKDAEDDVKEQTNKANLYKEFRTGDFKRFKVQSENDKEIPYMNQSVLTSFTLDDKEKADIQKSAENILSNIMDDNLFNGENIEGPEGQQYEVTSRNIKRLNYREEDKPEISGVFPAKSYFANTVARFGKYIEKYDKQIKEAGGDGFGDMTQQEYERIALKYLINNGLVNIEDNTINYYDAAELGDEKTRLGMFVDRTGGLLQYDSALANEAAKNNAISIDKSFVRDLKFEGNKLRQQLGVAVGENNVDEQQRIEEEIKLSRQLISAYENNDTDNEGFVQELDKRRLLYLLSIDENDNSYYKIPIEDGQEQLVRGSKITFTYKKSLYDNYIKEYGDDSELAEMFETTQPEIDENVEEVVPKGKPEVSQNDAERILNNDPTFSYIISGQDQSVKIPEIQLLSDEDLSLLSENSRSGYKAKLKRINTLKEELIAGEKLVQIQNVNSPGIYSPKPKSMTQRDFDLQINKIINFTNNFNSRYFDQVQSIKISDLQDNIQELELEIFRYNRDTPINVFDDNVIKNYENRIDELQEQILALQ